MNQLPNKMGWKRLLLTRQQKFAWDLQTLGQEKDPVDKFLYNLEGWITPSSLLRKLKRHGGYAIRYIYWHTFPKRLRVNYHGTLISEYLPWFKGYHLYQLGKGGRILKASGGDPEYTHSWKKAYQLMEKRQQEVENRRAQFEVNRILQNMNQQ